MTGRRGDAATAPRADRATKPPVHRSTGRRDDATTGRSLDQTTKPRDHRTTRRRSDRAMRLLDHAATKPPAHETTEPRDHQTAAPRNHRAICRRGDKVTSPQGHKATIPPNHAAISRPRRELTSQRRAGSRRRGETRQALGSKSRPEHTSGGIDDHKATAVGDIRPAWRPRRVFLGQGSPKQRRALSGEKTAREVTPSAGAVGANSCPGKTGTPTSLPSLLRGGCPS